MTTTWQAAGKVQGGTDVTAPELDAIARMYDEAKARIADLADPSAEPVATDLWPETEEIDVAAIEPPVPSRRSSTEPDMASNPLTAVARPATERPGALRRPWRRWFSLGAAAAR
jgi:hypothetical protein